jgi:hypothetical protein
MTAALIVGPLRRTRSGLRIDASPDRSLIPHPSATTLASAKEDTLIDTVAESEALRQRSIDLTSQLIAAVPVVDRRGIVAALVEGRRLADLAAAARAEVAKRLARGKSAGCRSVR